ncbi:MAG TPA: Hpt domain-containing protein, partial [Pyrinomonadaceae bacterium]|nr:Hpt domain-containing protein [Pyrinomonadaceae bacterium]
MDDEAARLEFLARAEELTDALYADLRLLRTAAAGGGRRAVLDRAFRHAHTLKGSAASLADADAIVRLAHGLEDLLDAARAGRLRPDAATLDACESAADSLANALENLARGGPPAEIDEPAGRLRALLREAELRAAYENDPEGAGIQVLKSLPDEIGAQLNEAERRRLAIAIGEGARAVSVRVAFDLERLDEGFRRLGDALEEAGEIVATLPGAEGADDATRVSLCLVCATGESSENLSRRLAEFGAEVDPLFDRDGPEVSPSAEDAETQAGVGGAHAATGSPEFVRVPLAELDELAFAASELFDETTAALEAARANAADTAEATESERRAARLREHFLALEDRVLSLRMQPLA